MADDKSEQDAKRNLRDAPGSTQTEPHASETLFNDESDPPLGSKAAEARKDDSAASAQAKSIRN
jgi:hypothetical protein